MKKNRKSWIYAARVIVASAFLVLAVLGIAFSFYPFNILDVQIAALVQRNLVAFSTASVVLLALSLLIAFFFGRAYCSLACPLGAIQDLICIAMGGIFKRRRSAYAKGGVARYIVASVFWGLLFGGFFLGWVDPYAAFGSALSLSLLGSLLVAAVVVLTLFRNRAFCSFICPAGTLLGVVAGVSPFRMSIDPEKCVSCGRCEAKCPSMCVDSKGGRIDADRCLMCLGCLSGCPKDAVSFGVARERKPFSPSRRRFIAGLSSAALFGAAAFAGASLSGKAGGKSADVIVPPGAGDPGRFLAKCLNCNLCVSACPGHIIKKADGNYGAVSLDMSSGFCRFDCARCSEVCPSGAIRRISLEEKRRTRIAVAVIDRSSCIGCGRCDAVCPQGAVKGGRKEGYSIDGSSCIGCGSCSAACPKGAVSVWPAKRQVSL